MRIMIGIAFVGTMILVLVLGIAWAQSVPQLINYQGRLTNASGQPLDGETVDISFAFYGTQTGGTAYLSVLQEDVLVTEGIYNILIGSGTITPGSESSLAGVFKNHSDVWMGVKVDTDPEMNPRARITSVPYALTVDPRYIGDMIAKSDWDDDGYLKTGNTVDCNDGDASIHPGATENCYDGYDNDCDGIIDANDPDCWATPPGMALIPAGCFDMGDAFSEFGIDQLPVHNVCLTSSFFMDIHEVTNAEYMDCVTAGGCVAPIYSYSNTRGSYYGNLAYNDFPVIYVTWNQANAYCNWAGKRLPSEAEWEYAARGGLSGKRYPWGDNINGTFANYYNSGDPWDNDTSPVEYYAPNGYGIYDMAGNVIEWVNDWYLDTYYSTSPINDPPGPISGTYRVFRNGCYGSQVTLNLRVSHRNKGTPDSVYYDWIGFRCAKN